MLSVEDCHSEAFYLVQTELKGKVLHRFKGEGVWCVLGIARRINILSDVNISDINREYIAVF
jgi:hypothetical protein